MRGAGDREVRELADVIAEVIAGQSVAFAPSASVSASVGVATFSPQDRVGPAEVMARADLAIQAVMVALLRREEAQLRPRLEALDSPLEHLDVDLLSRLLLTVGEELGRTALDDPDLPVARLVDTASRFLDVLPWR